jgi:ADP-ribosylglycohydrolase
MADAIMTNPWLWLDSHDLETELQQLDDEGKDISASLRRRMRRLIRMDAEELATPGRQEKARDLLREGESLPLRKDYEFVEPSDLGGIRELRADGPRTCANLPPLRELQDRLTGAWLGRCIGCLLGKAAEGVKADRFWPFLKATGQWPIREYLRFDRRGKVAEEFPDLVRRDWCDKVEYMPVDDDTNYTLTGHLIVKKHGASFTSRDVGQFWMANIPLLSTCTAERVAYRNLTNTLLPPRSAIEGNPYREWIGAQIRADALGYVNMGNPERAAEFAHRDASISHVKNGIYGEMLMAAVIAAAAKETDPEKLLVTGLSEIPKTSRLWADVMEVIAWREQGLTYDQAIAMIHERWDDHNPHHWCHTISNAMICAVALLWGEGEFGPSVGMAVQAAFDTDCNGATVGSIVGMMRGASGIPSRWTDRLNNTLHTSLRGYHEVRITDMAAETFTLYRDLR